MYFSKQTRLVKAWIIDSIVTLIMAGTAALQVLNTVLLSLNTQHDYILLIDIKMRKLAHLSEEYPRNSMKTNNSLVKKKGNKHL